MATKTLFIVGLLLTASSSAAAQTTCAPGAPQCSTTTQTNGDTKQSAVAEATKADVNQAGTAQGTQSAISGAEISPDIQQNATTRTGDVRSDSRGNTTDARTNATAGASNGNQSFDGKQAFTGAVQGSTNGTVKSETNGTVLGVTGPSAAEASNSGGNNQVAIDASDKSSSAVSVDAADRSSTNIDARSKVLFIPSVVPDSLPVGLAGATIVQQSFGCGPRQEVIRTPVTGAYIGFFKTSQIDQGFTDTLVDAPIPFARYDLPNGGYMLLGHQVLVGGAVIGLGGARNLAFGGGGGGGGWGQGGGGASSSAQRMVKDITLRSCVYKAFEPVPVVPAYADLGEKG